MELQAEHARVPLLRAQGSSRDATARARTPSRAAPTTARAKFRFAPPEWRSVSLRPTASSFFALRPAPTPTLRARLPRARLFFLPRLARSPLLFRLHALLFLQASVLSVSYSPQGECIASGSKDRTVRLWTPSTVGLYTPKVLKAHSGAVRSVRFSPRSSSRLRLGR